MIPQTWWVNESFLTNKQDRVAHFPVLKREELVTCLETILKEPRVYMVEEKLLSLLDALKDHP